MAKIRAKIAGMALAASLCDWWGTAWAQRHAELGQDLSYAMGIAQAQSVKWDHSPRAGNPSFEQPIHARSENGQFETAVIYHANGTLNYEHRGQGAYFMAVGLWGWNAEGKSCVQLVNQFGKMDPEACKVSSRWVGRYQVLGPP